MSKQESIKTAMIMAAGYGTRMGELSHRMPKPLLPIANRPVLNLILEKLKNTGIKKVIINIHFKKDLIKKHIASSTFTNLQIYFSEEKELMGTGGGIAHAEKYFNNETILVINSDILCDISLKDVFRFFIQNQSMACMVVVPSSNFREYNLVHFRNQQIIDFLPKGKPVQYTKNTGIFTGIQILSPDARKYLKKSPSSILDTFYRPALANGEKILAFIHQGIWIDIGTKEKYLEISQKFASGQLKINKFTK